MVSELSRQPLGDILNAYLLPGSQVGSIFANPQSVLRKTAALRHMYTYYIKKVVYGQLHLGIARGSKVIGSSYCRISHGYDILLHTPRP